MNVPLDSTYTSELTASNSLDTAFPVYQGTAVNDPIQYTCQANAIVTIGDSHTWYDTRVPSSGGPTASYSNQSALAVVNNVDAAQYATALGNLPLIEGVATPANHGLLVPHRARHWAMWTSPTGTTNSTYNMAGCLDFAHTQDIRSDLSGKQTVDTYTVDVLEPGSYDGSSGKEIFNPAKLQHLRWRCRSKHVLARGKVRWL